MATDALGEERPTLFLRKATGLVRGWSVRDSMIYACLSTNVITLGLVEFAYQDAFPAGQLLTKAQRLTMLRSGELKIETYRRDDEKIRVYGDTAVVTYRSTVQAQRNGQDISSQRRVITVLVRRDSRWQAVAQQSTAIAQR